MIIRCYSKIVVAGLLLLTAACSPPASPISTRTSIWGSIITVGQSEQLDAPAIWPEADRVRVAWIGADKTGVHQDIRTLNAAGLSERVVLPLPPVHPYGQQFAAASTENLHLLWLDDNQSGETRLYDAEITSGLVIDRGPSLVTEQSAHRFIVVPNGKGEVWVISSGGLLAEPGLFIRYVDAAGRPRLSDDYRLTSDADWPAFDQRSDGTIDVYWIAYSDGQVFRAALTDGVLDNPQPITSTVNLNSGDRLESFSAGLDHTHAYLFWNITRADGQTETWMASGLLDSTDWAAPVRLQIDTTLTGSFETGFNSGSAQAAQPGTTSFAWAKPLNTQVDTLAVAGVVGKQLVLLYYKNGTLVGYQDIARISGLFSAPNLLTDRDRHLYLAWTEPTARGYADLNLTMTRRF